MSSALSRGNILAVAKKSDETLDKARVRRVAAPWTAGVEKITHKGDVKPRTMRDALHDLSQRTAIGGVGKTVDDLARALVENALEGDAASMKICWDRLDGPVVQRLEAEVSKRTKILILRPTEES